MSARSLRRGTIFGAIGRYMSWLRRSLSTPYWGLFFLRRRLLAAPTDASARKLSRLGQPAPPPADLVLRTSHVPCTGCEIPAFGKCQRLTRGLLHRTLHLQTDRTATTARIDTLARTAASTRSRDIIVDHELLPPGSVRRSASTLSASDGQDSRFGPRPPLPSAGTCRREIGCCELCVLIEAPAWNVPADRRGFAPQNPVGDLSAPACVVVRCSDTQPRFGSSCAQLPQRRQQYHLQNGPSPARHRHSCSHVRTQLPLGQ